MPILNLISTPLHLGPKATPELPLLLSSTGSPLAVLKIQISAGRPGDRANSSQISGAGLMHDAAGTVKKKIKLRHSNVPFSFPLQFSVSSISSCPVDYG